MKNEIRNLLLVVFSISLLAVIITPCVADTIMDIEPRTHEIPKGDNYVYMIELYSTVEITRLDWITEPGLTARMKNLDGEWTKYSVEHFVYISHPGDGTRFYEIDIKVDDDAAERLHFFNIETYDTFLGRACASVTGSAYPTPELSTVVLMSAGLLGLIVMVRRQRKD